MKIKTVAAVNTSVSDALNKDGKQGKPRYNTAKDNQEKKEADTVNYRLQKKMGLVPDIQQEAKPETSLLYEKNIEKEDYYVGKYLNIVV